MKKKLFSLAKTPVGDLIVGLAFGKLSKALAVDKIAETDKVVAFWHPKPFYEKHILIVPKKAIKNLSSIKNNDMDYLKEVLKVAKEIIDDQGWEKEGYSLLANGGNKQEVNQLHFHLYSD